MRRDTNLSARDQFLIKEYELLFQRNEQAQQNRWKFLQFFMISVGAFYAAFFSTEMSLSKSPAVGVLIWFPVFFAFAGGAMAWGLRLGMLQRGSVMGQIEKHFDAPGWETKREIDRKNIRLISPLTTATYVLWFCLVLGTSLIAVLTRNGSLVHGGGN